MLRPRLAVHEYFTSVYSPTRVLDESTPSTQYTRDLTTTCELAGGKWFLSTAAAPNTTYACEKFKKNKKKFKLKLIEFKHY